jgi:hypothetical protein
MTRARMRRENDFLFVIAGLDPAIHAEDPLAEFYRMFVARHFSMDHRVQPGGDEAEKMTPLREGYR